MKLHKIIIVTLGAVLLATLTGCDRSAKELENAKADLASAKAELATMKANTAEINNTLAATIIERDTLKADLEKVNASVSVITEESNKLKAQVDALTKAKDTAADAATANAQLTTQLKEQTQKALTSETKIKELEKLIETLKSQLKTVQDVSVPKL